MSSDSWASYDHVATGGRGVDKFPQVQIDKVYVWALLRIAKNSRQMLLLYTHSKNKALKLNY